MAGSYSFKRDVNQALIMADSLEGYVRGNRLYGVTTAGLQAQMPSMTVGGLLLRLHRLGALRNEIPDFLTKKVDKAIDRYEYVRSEWAYHFEQKVLQEAHSRIDAMKGFFYECADNIRLCIGIYKPEIMRRTIVEHLRDELKRLNATDGTLEAKIIETDDKLRRYVEPSTFQWATVLQAAYPIEDYWWLYHSPPDLP